MADEIDGERLIRENPFNVISEKGIKTQTKKRVTFLNDVDISKLITFYMNYDNLPASEKMELLGKVLIT